MVKNSVSNKLSVPYVNKVATIGTSNAQRLLCHKMMIVVIGHENCQFSGDYKISWNMTTNIKQ